MSETAQQIAAIFQKAKESNKEEDLFTLLEIGRTKGFESFLNRKAIWPFLLKVNMDPLGDSKIFEWKEKMDRNSTDYEQLQKDADRSLSSMKTFQNITKFHLKKRQQAVLSVLDTFFSKNKDLRYIQGFHDVASIFLILYGNNIGYYMMEKAGRVYFHDFLTYEFGQLGSTLSMMIYQILIKQDPSFQSIFGCYAESKCLIFILPWILTWFSHVFSSVKTICRIWDYILSTGPHGVLYLTVGIILSTKSQLLKAGPQFDQATIHMFYQDQVKNQLIDIQQSIRISIKIQAQTQVTSLTTYNNLQKQSIFRYENLFKNFPFFKNFYQYLKSSEKKRNIIKKTVIVLATTLIIAGTIGAMYYFKGEKSLKWFSMSGKSQL